jgi:hypothetical protein
MDASALTPARFGALSRIVDAVRERPGVVLAWVLGAHFVVWAVLPILLYENLQLDLVEGLALGKEWQLGYWKHPPLPWWVIAAAHQATGQLYVVYLLGPLCSVACLYLIWRLGRETLGPLPALVAVLSLEGLHFLNFSAVKFSHDVLQLPLWALSALFFYRALTRRRPLDWIAGGTFVAVAFWSKYTAFILGVCFLYILIFEREGRRSWRTSGPYLMGAAFLIVLSPHLWWLVTHDFQPLHYFDERAAHAVQWYQNLWFPLKWTVGQVFFLVPALALLAIVYVGRRRAPRLQMTNFARRYLLTLAIGPFLVTTLIGILLGRSMLAMWGFPLWLFAPLGLMAWYPPHLNREYLRHFAAGFSVLFVFLPLVYSVSELLGEQIDKRPRAAQFPGVQVSEMITARWRERTGLPLRFVGGLPSGHGPGEFAANNVAVYSPDRPHVIVHGKFANSAWVDPEAVARDGAVFAWEQISDEPVIPRDLLALFPALEPQPAIKLPRLGPFSRGKTAVHSAFLLPKR